MTRSAPLSWIPPQVRVEWLIAISRVLLASGALFAMAISPANAPAGLTQAYALGWYLVYSLLVLALVWTPVRFARGWGLAQHGFDLAAFSLFSFYTDAVSSPFFVYFTFLVICGTLRWRVPGAVWTALLTALIYAASSTYASFVLQLRPFAFDSFVIRIVHLSVVAALVGYLGEHHYRFQREIGSLVGWPRRVPREPRELVTELVAECSEVLEAPRVLIVWEDPDEGSINVACGAGTDVSVAVEPEGTFGSFVVSALDRRPFQTIDAADDRAMTVHWSAGSFRQRAGRPIHPTLQTRFAIGRAQSWSLDGELIRGRLFALDKGQMRLDELIFGDVVSRLVVSRLDSLYLLRRLGRSAALEERLRLARDIHDSLLQTAAGSALQLLAARRLLDKDPEAARQRLEEVQNQIEHGELEMRTFIRRLRPIAPDAREAPVGLNERLLELRRRVERQWEISVRLHVPDDTASWPDGLVDGVYRIVQEGVLNAARHADPSLITVDLTLEGERVKVQISDDGRGFPFRGTYDLDTLNAMNQGPLTIKERVAELQGALELRSSETGTELSIALPLAPASV